MYIFFSIKVFSFSHFVIYNLGIGFLLDVCLYPSSNNGINSLLCNGYCSWQPIYFSAIVTAYGVFAACFCCLIFAAFLCFKVHCTMLFDICPLAFVFYWFSTFLIVWFSFCLALICMKLASIFCKMNSVEENPWEVWFCRPWVHESMSPSLP